MILLYFGMGIIVGIIIVGMFAVIKEDERQQDLDEALREAYLKGYENGLKDSE